MDNGALMETWNRMRSSVSVNFYFVTSVGERVASRWRVTPTWASNCLRHHLYIPPLSSRLPLPFLHSLFFPPAVFFKGMGGSHNLRSQGIPIPCFLLSSLFPSSIPFFLSLYILITESGYVVLGLFTFVFQVNKKMQVGLSNKQQKSITYSTSLLHVVLTGHSAFLCWWGECEALCPSPTCEIQWSSIKRSLQWLYNNSHLAHVATEHPSFHFDVPFSSRFTVGRSTQTLTAHITYYQGPKRRPIGFLWLSPEVHGYTDRHTTSRVIQLPLEMATSAEV